MSNQWEDPTMTKTKTTPKKRTPKAKAVLTITYSMQCPEGSYQSDTWLGLGWDILMHRLGHLWRNGSFMD